MKISTCAAVAALTLSLSACGSSGSDSQRQATSTGKSPAATSSNPTVQPPGGDGCVDAEDNPPSCSPTSVVPEKPTGNPLGDANRKKYVEQGSMTQNEANAIGWAGDVRTKDGSFVEYDNGLRITFVSAKKTTAPISEDNKDSEINTLDPSKRLIRVTLQVSNSSKTAIQIDSTPSPFSLYEGANISEVESFTGYQGEDLNSNNVQSVVGPGSTFTVYHTYQVPPGSDLVAQTETPYFGEEWTPYVFYGFKVT